MNQYHESPVALNPLEVLANAALGLYSSQSVGTADASAAVNSNIHDTASNGSYDSTESRTPQISNGTTESYVQRTQSPNTSELKSSDAVQTELEVEAELEANAELEAELRAEGATEAMIDQQRLQCEALTVFGITPRYADSHDGEGEEDKPNTLSGPALAACGIQPDDDYLISSLEGNEPGEASMSKELIQMNERRRTRKNGNKIGSLQRQKRKPDFFGQFATYPELFMELAKHMDIYSLVSLYSISKDFHEILNGHMSHVMKTCAAYQAPESSRIFVFNLYESLCMPDPVGRPHPTKPGLVRNVPSLRWLAMVSHREKSVRDILACMARESHRMPKSMSMSLKKMWLTMDISTSARRAQLMHNEKYWTDRDLYNIQMFVMKLDMRFNDPIDGPADDGLRKLFLGQKGLSPLRDLLKRTRFTSVLEIVRLAVSHAGIEGYGSPDLEHMSLFGIPPSQIGIGHLEGWGRGKVHLYRIDELVLREAVRRNLELDQHMMDMMFWGYVDPITKRNIEPSAEETYMSDDDKNASKVGARGKGKVKMEDDDDTEMVEEEEGWENDRDEEMSG